MYRKVNNYIIFLVLYCILIVFSFLIPIYESKNELPRHGLKIDHKYLHQNSSGIIFHFDHEYGQNYPNDLVLKINNGQGKSYYQSISQINHSSITHKISLKSSQIKNIFLQSQSSLKIKKNGRVLLSIEQLPSQFISITKFFTYFFSGCRNIIILATITGSFDIWMPLLIFVQTFICLGFWTHDPHVFKEIYSRIFNSNIDLFNLIRLSLSNGVQLSTNPYLAHYGFTNLFAINCSGELSAFLVLLFVIFILKILTLFIKSQRLRSIVSKIRPSFNGFMFWISPRILSLAGISLRFIQTDLTVIQIINLAIAALLIAIIIAYFVLLVIQIKKINSKLEYIKESRYQIGLALRIDYMKDFQFDCLQYSMLYYPAMNILRIIFTHLCIGFAPDFHYVQYGGVIFGQVSYMMIQISCSGYKLTRDKIIYPILDFIYGTFLLCLIGIGLIYGVGHLELTMKLEKYAFCAIILITSALTIQILLDIIMHIKELKQNTQEEQTKSKKKIPNNSSTKYSQQQKDRRVYRYQNEQIQTVSGQSKGQKLQKPKQKENSGKKVKKVKNGKFI